MGKNKKNRKKISKKVRFEVFKRDSFKCQYCGKSAPDVMLEIDHIKPVSKDGTNDITNLISACHQCNGGKADIPLDDKSAVAKSKKQLDDLQERREQLDMMMQWHDGLSNLNEQAIERYCSYWKEKAPAHAINGIERDNIRKWVLLFTPEAVLHGMDIAATKYLSRDEDGEYTPDSCEKAFSMIPRICQVEKESEEDPEIKDIYYIRGILRKRHAEVSKELDEARAMQILKDARASNVSMDDLRRIAKSVNSLSEFEMKVSEEKSTG